MSPSFASAPQPLVVENLLFIQSNSLKGSNTPPGYDQWLSDEVYRARLLSLMPRLAMCESSDIPDKINPHDKGSPSYGLYQYKETTWVEQIRKYEYLSGAEDSELMNYIFDREWQDKITLLTLQEPGGWRKWTNCWESITK